jgi:transposase
LKKIRILGLALAPACCSGGARLLAKLRALLHAGGFLGFAHDSGGEKRDSRPDRSSHPGLCWYDFVVYKKRNQVRRTDSDTDTHTHRPMRGMKTRLLTRMSITNPAKTDPMATTTVMPSASPLATLRSKLRDYYTLTKPEVNLLILMTTSAGYYLASRGPFRIVGLINTLVGTLLVASGTATLNQWMERVWDGQMRRTASRPLPSGRLTSREALVFGLLLSVAGGLYLLLAVNLLAACWRFLLCSPICWSTRRSSARRRCARCWALSPAPCRR